MTLKAKIQKVLREKIIGESTKFRGSSKSKLMTKELRKSARQLRDNDDIVIRRADEASTFVILDKETYLHGANEWHA